VKSILTAASRISSTLGVVNVLADVAPNTTTLPEAGGDEGGDRAACDEAAKYGFYSGA
jgi:hypothetical protein